MSRFVLLVLALLPLMAWSESGATDRRELAARYFKIAGLEAVYTDRQKIDVMLQAMMRDLVQASAVEMTPEQVRELEKRFNSIRPSINAIVLGYFERVQPSLIDVIARTYTAEELQAMLAFYSSPVGQSVAAKSMDVVIGMTEVTGRHSQLMNQELYNTIISHIQAVMSGHQK